MTASSMAALRDSNSDRSRRSESLRWATVLAFAIHLYLDWSANTCSTSDRVVSMPHRDTSSGFARDDPRPEFGPPLWSSLLFVSGPLRAARAGGLYPVITRLLRWPDSSRTMVHRTLST